LFFSPTLFTYFARHFISYVLSIFLIIMAIIFLLDVVEFLRRGASKETVSMALILEMAILKAPSIGYKILPFAVLFGSMMAFAKIVNSSELVAAHAAGLTIWQILIPSISVVLIIGVLWIAAINPISSALTAKFESLENRVLRNQNNALSLSPGGLWIREKNPNGHSVLHARAISNDGATLSNVTIFIFKNEDEFSSRIDAKHAKLKTGFWELNDTVLITDDGVPKKVASSKLLTRLTVDNIQDSFASPTTMSFWDLPQFISVLEKAGFSAVRHRLHWHALLASPLLLCAMVLIAATFSLRLSTRTGSKKWILAGLFFGFFLYFMTDLVFALGLSGRIPEVFAAWTPVMVTTLIGITSLLYLEDA
jgi:lipopolysaccharide export system permease protein